MERPLDMFERFTDRARRVLVLAQEVARLKTHNYIGTEHILAGLIREGEGVAGQVLTSLGITTDKFEEHIELGGEQPIGSPPFTPRAKKVLELALREALQLGHSYIGTEHLLLGMVREGEGVAMSIIQDHFGIDPSAIRQTVIQKMSGSQSKPPKIYEPVEVPFGYKLTAAWLHEVADGLAEGELDLTDVENALTGWIKHQDIRRSLPEYQKDD